MAIPEKIKGVQVLQENGEYSDPIPFEVNAENVTYNTRNVKEVIEDLSTKTFPLPTEKDEGKVLIVKENQWALGDLDLSDYYTKEESDNAFIPIDNALKVEEKGDKVVNLSPTIEWSLQGLKVQGKSIQEGEPSPESPASIISAGESGSISLSITDNAEKNQLLVFSTPSGLPGIPVDSNGNYTDASGQQFMSTYWDFEDGQQHILCGEITSYNNEEITTPYISTTGALTIGARVLYVLPKPQTKLIPTEIMATYGALTTYNNITVISSSENIGIEAAAIANGTEYLDQKINEAVTAATLISLGGANI